MSRNSILILLCGAMLMCSSCSMFTSKDKKPAGGGSATPVQESTREVNALHINIKSDPQLNLYQGRSHSLLICLYQLKDPNAFNQLADEEGGIAKLLECGRFDASVANAKRQVIQPGKAFLEERERAQGANYLGVVAGYYNSKKEGVIRLQDISAKGFWKKTPTFDLTLGSKYIENLQVK